MTPIIFNTFPYSAPFDLANKPFIAMPWRLIELLEGVLEFRLRIGKGKRILIRQLSLISHEKQN